MKDILLKDLYGIDERKDVQKVKINSTGESHCLYLFPCNGLLGEDQRIAIDEQRRIIGIYQENTLVNETHVTTWDISVLMTLVLSYPLPVKVLSTWQCS